MVRKYIEIGFVIGCLVLVIFGGTFLYWYFKVDGVLWNRVVEFPENVDPSNLHTVQKQYHRGDLIQLESAFCKTREAQASTKWTLANDSLIPLQESNWDEIPIGCYPVDGVLKIDIAKVPQTAIIGTHYIVGVTTHLLPGNRIRKQYYRSEPFEVIP